MRGGASSHRGGGRGLLGALGAGRLRAVPANELQNLGGGDVACGVREDNGSYGFPLLVRTGLPASLRDLLVRKALLEPWDLRPCDGATVGDIDLLALRDALQRMGVFTVERGIEPYLEEGVQLSPFVPSLCVAEPLTRTLRPRNYAILLFGREPQRFVPGAFSIYSTYPGLDRSDPTALRHEIPGTLLDQARRLGELLDAEAVTLFDKTNLKTPNVDKYPRRALQEAMVNALAHRDYALVDPTRFTSFADRIEVLSPGSLPSGISLADLSKGTVTPRWRSQSLAWFLNRLQLAQAEGQGILTIRRAMKAAGCPPPRFNATEVSVSCTLRAHPRFREKAALKSLGPAPVPRTGAKRRRKGKSDA